MNLDFQYFVCITQFARQAAEVIERLTAGARQRESDGQSVLVAAGTRVGQHLRAGQIDQLPWHCDVVRTEHARLERVVHVSRTGDVVFARSVFVTSWTQPLSTQVKYSRFAGCLKTGVDCVSALLNTTLPCIVYISQSICIDLISIATRRNRNRLDAQRDVIMLDLHCHW